MNVLEELGKHHNEWLRMVKSFGAKSEAEDIVQDVYLRIHKYIEKHQAHDKIIKDGKVNKPFVFISLRNTYIMYCKDEKKRVQCVWTTCPNFAKTKRDYNTKSENKFFNRLNQETDSWHWYDKMLFTYYMESGRSYRDLAEESNISLTSIWNTMKNCKERIKDNLSEDWEDLNNGDFERL
ncbi:RNA polymerase sigma factor [Lysinibacillus pakistanensis]|uniref:Sigma-70 family RNA polymerase sigma factor n=1 Tax=Lysinibacillus pakistanensis TaxID=759811 RepID=A0ABX6DHT3_9BACI|nr:hypothetical protein GDS87_24540 [Lysinibacillus pakistanensis]